jgi:hypothetical protein
LVIRILHRVARPTRVHFSTGHGCNFPPEIDQAD